MDSFTLMYLKDLLVLAVCAIELDAIVEDLKIWYELLMLDRINWFFGVQLTWKLDSNGLPASLSMDQSSFAESVLGCFRL